MSTDGTLSRMPQQAFAFRDEFFSTQHHHFNCKLFNMRSVTFIAILVVVISSNAAAEGNFPPIWPHPQKLTNGSASLTVDSINFQFSSNFLQRDCVDIYNSFSRFSPVFFPHSPPRKSTVALSVPAITGVSVTILNCSVPLQLGVDESYSLEVDISGGCAATSWTCFAFFLFCSFIAISLIFGLQRRQSQCVNRLWSLPCSADLESANRL